MISPTQGARHAARRLLRAPAFTAAAVLTLALGIGASTAVFSLVNGVLLRALPFPESDRLVDLSHALLVSGVTNVDQSDASYLHYRRGNRVFTDVGGYRSAAVNLGRTSGGAGGDLGGAERVMSARVSASTLRVLRVTPSHGRALGDADDELGAPPVALVGERLWKRKYGGDPGLVGRRVEIDGVAREVVGIMPAGFGFPTSGTELWLPIDIDAGNTESATFDYRAVARLRDGVSLESAQADLQRLLLTLPEAFPGRLTAAAIEQTEMRAVVRTLRDVVVGDVGRALWIVTGAVGFVLLVACANVANLFLVRAEGRRQELAIRRAIGAGQGRIVAEFVTEGLMLSTVGGALGVATAAALVGVIRSMDAGIDIPRLDEVGVDGVALAVALGLTLLVALLISAVPAVRSVGPSLSSTLTEAGRQATAGRARSRTRSALVAAQVALALVLLTGAGLMARSFARLRSVEPGFDPAPAFTFRVALPGRAYPAPGDPARFYLRALDQVAELPGVTAAGLVSKLPLDPEARRDTALWIQEQPLQMGAMPNVHQVVYASPGYFAALGIPFVEGGAFEAPDPAKAPLQLVVSRALAARYWSSTPVVGKRVRTSPIGPWFTIVGVAGDVRGTALDGPPDETIYLPLVTAPGPAAADGASGPARWTPNEMAFVVRGATAGAVSQVAAGASGVVRAIDPAVPVYAARPMRDVVARAAARTSFTLVLLGLASAVALALGAIGIYGVISYVVSLRTREIAVRLAIGARPADVRRMVARQAVGVAALGVAAGLAGAVAMTRFMSALLFGVSPTDPLTLAGAALLLLAAALAASWIPARRAAGVNPAIALRTE